MQLTPIDIIQRTRQIQQAQKKPRTSKKVDVNALVNAAEPQSQRQTKPVWTESPQQFPGGCC